MRFAEIPFASPAYESSKRLRHEVLRVPLGMVLSDADIADEDQQIHIAAFDAMDALVGIVLLKPLPSGNIKLRQMAIAAHCQGGGTGKKLVQFAEGVALARGFTMIEADARVYAQGFYEKMNYCAIGEPFIQSTIHHIKMTKTLR